MCKAPDYGRNRYLSSDQDHLTGAEIAFGGDLIRCLKNDNYLVLETEAQGYPGWTPYDGQLRLQAYSHLASGALGVMYSRFRCRSLISAT